MVKELTISEYEKTISREMNDRLDQLEAELLLQPQVECPVQHFFMPGMYARQIFMPADTMIMSMIHKETHPYVVTRGMAFVKVNDEHWEKIEAPFYGFTKAGTRRTLLIKENCVWTTYHRVDFITGSENDLAGEERAAFLNKIVECIYEKHDNPYLKNLGLENIKEGIKCQD